MHVLRRSSSSYRLAMRLSSSVLRRPFSRDFVHHRETTSSPWNIRNKTAKSRHLSHSSCLNKKKKDVSSNQQDSLDSARFSRIGKIPSNQQDYLESARFLRIGQTLSLGLAAPESGRHSPTTSLHRDTSPHSYPEPETQPCSVICHRGIHRTFSGSCGNLCGPEATDY